MNRKHGIKQLQELVDFHHVTMRGQDTEHLINIGSWRAILLKNRLTGTDCQIFECTYDPDAVCDSGAKEHAHPDSQEVFYQLVGETIFGDGIVLRAGEFRVIAPGVPHSCKTSKDGRCIVIIHPPLESFPKGIQE